ncbi:dimethylarginine dimethylaminohydrolase family protein [Chungangia koreensis]|uniref:Dimethylarginine dimethylaminohydrolase family protein n=1 Tax=Chungangia koreensis TaxID=752657 RepID=A0ABV8X1B4_9LACT
MRAIKEVKQQIVCHTEYEALEKVIVCQPKYMEITEVINEVQEEYAEENINRLKAMEQHKAFTDALAENGVTVYMLPPAKTKPEQVFTRDIGFTIGHTLYISEMASDIRQGEEEVLTKWLSKNSMPHKRLFSKEIEGGDVIIDGKRVFVGLSSRTNEDTVKSLKKLLPNYEVIPIEFDQKYLHLDCVFNILSPEDALIFPEALQKETVHMLKGMYKTIEVNAEEQFTMGTNVLSIGHKKVFSLPVNKEVNQNLRERGYTVIEVDLSEIIKSGGSFRCCTLPIKRTEIIKD